MKPSRLAALPAFLAMAALGAGGSLAQSDVNEPSAGTQQERPREEPRARTRQQPGIVVGELVNVRDVSLRQGAQVHRFLQLKTAGGTTVLVDIGVAAKLGEELTFDEGDRLIAIGRPGRVDDRRILYATSIGELHRVRSSTRRDPLLRRNPLRQAEGDLPRESQSAER